MPTTHTRGTIVALHVSWLNDAQHRPFGAPPSQPKPQLSKAELTVSPLSQEVRGRTRAMPTYADADSARMLAGRQQRIETFGARARRAHTTLCLYRRNRVLDAE